MEELRRLLREFSKNYGEKGREVAETAERLLAEGMTPDEAVKEAFRLCGVEEWLADNVNTVLLETAQSALPEEAVSLITAEEMLQSLASPWDGSGMTLSEKLHGTAEDMRKRIADTVKDQLRRNRNIRQAAEALYDGYHAGRVVRQQQLPQYIKKLMTLYRRSKGNLSDDEYEKIMKQLRGVLRQHERLTEDGAAYNHFRTAVAELVTAVLEKGDKAVHNALWAAAQEKSRYAAERIARTEGARAYYDAFMAQYEADGRVVAFQWKKSSRHPAFDICDLYAEADLYGLGKGVFPKDKAPGLPAHPHCLCHYSPVYPSELEGKTEKDRVQAGGARYIKMLTKSQREALLGVKGAAAYQIDGNWRKHARGWKSLVQTQSRIDLTTMTMMPASDIINMEIAIPEQLEFIDKSSERHLVPRSSLVTVKRIIAGDGSEDKNGNRITLRCAQELTQRYGGDADKWAKAVGVILSDKYVLDIHFYYHQARGAHEFKVKSNKKREVK